MRTRFLAFLDIKFEQLEKNGIIKKYKKVKKWIINLLLY